MSGKQKKNDEAQWHLCLTIKEQGLNLHLRLASMILVRNDDTDQIE